MLWLVAISLAVFVVLGLVVRIVQQRASSDDRTTTQEAVSDAHNEAPDAPQYRVRQNALLSESELNFARELDAAARLLLDSHGPVRVAAKVNLADLLSPACQRGSNTPYRSWLNSIDRKHVDFVLVDADWKPVCAIELDDKSHNRPAASKNDATKDNAFHTAGLPFIRVATKRGYSRHDLARRITEATPQARQPAAQ
ncbi:MAG: DUF2726 domain-containing protein [Planctomycetota bacterium]